MVLKAFQNYKIFIILLLFLVSGCGGNKKDNFDFSSFKKPAKELKTEEKKSSLTEQTKSIKYKLKALKERDVIISSTKFGERDPFSLNSDISGELSKLKLKGFLTISDKNYAIISYLDNEGPLLVESIGGVNTNLLPKGAVINEIRPNEGYVKITNEGEIFTLDLEN